MRFFLLLWALLPLSLEWQFKTFSTQLTSAICFLLVPGRCLTSQKIKIETMKANDFNFLLSYLQVYLNLPLFLSLPWGSRKLWMLSEEHSQWLWWAPPPPLVSTLLVLLIHLLCLVLTVLGTSCNSLSLYYLSSFFLSQLLKHVWNKHPLLNYLLLK